MKRVALILEAVCLAVTAAFGASAAGDNSRITAEGGTVGITVASASARGRSMMGTADNYIGSTDLGANTFGLFNTFTTTTTDAIRPFTGVLNAGDTFSINLGFSPFNTAGGSVGINLRSGT